jgi:hypothetical protein
MVVTHIPVVDALILQRERVTAPADTLLQSAYDAMIASLNAEKAAALDRDYVQGQVEHQKGNAALFRYEISERHGSPSERICATNPAQDRRPSASGLKFGQGRRPIRASTE